MGLGFCIKNDDYKCEARWSYTGFFNFRKKIATHLNLILELDENFRWVGKNFSAWDKDWLLFLTHSDCDGVLNSRECKRIVKKLKIVIDEMKEEPPGHIYDFYDIENAEKLIEAMEYCAENKKTLVFC